MRSNKQGRIARGKKREEWRGWKNERGERRGREKGDIGMSMQTTSI